MSRRKSMPGAGDQPSFEDALAGLEAVVADMEEGRLPLEQLVARYEQGAALLQRCEAILTAARDRISLITLRAPAGGDPEASASAADGDDPADDSDDDIRLF